MEHNNHGCKSCGACKQCEMCNHCGSCRNCGKQLAQPIFWQPNITQPSTWSPDYNLLTTITWGTQSGNISSSGTFNS